MVATMSLVLFGCGVDDSGYVSPIPEEKPEEPEEKPDKPKEIPKIPQLEQQACTMTQETWSKAHKGAGIEETIEAFGCKGALSYINEMWNASKSEISQRVEWVWGDDLSKPTAIITYVDGKLDQKYFTPKSVDTVSSCFPTEEQRATLKHEQTLDEVQKSFGCKGIYQYSNESDFTVTHYYMWKKDKDSEEQLITIFSNDQELIDSRYIPPKKEDNKALSTCIPNYLDWIKVTRREALKDAERKLGCTSVNGNLWDEKDETVKVWGKSALFDTINPWGLPDRSAHFTALMLDKDNYVVSKHFYAKDSVSSCMPSLKNWQNSKMNSSYALIKQEVQCEGVLSEVHTELDSGDFSSEKDLTKVYQWQNKLESDNSAVGRIYHEMIFSGDRLIKKQYSRSNFLTCQPSKTAFTQIKLGNALALDALNKTMGCSAELTYSVVALNDRKEEKTTQYAWGDINGSYAYINVDNKNRILNKYIKFSPTN